MTGCRNDAKWTARKWVDDAVVDGARVITQADVKKVSLEKGRAVGRIGIRDPFLRNAHILHDIFTKRRH